MPIAPNVEYVARNIIPANYIGATDPALDADNGVQTGKTWLVTDEDPPTEITEVTGFRVRNLANDAWIDIAIGGGSGSIVSGTGSPEGVVTADVGAIYVQTNASPDSDGLWYKKTGSGNTGWVNVTASEGSGGSGTFVGAEISKAGQSIPENSNTVVSFDTEGYDTDGFWVIGTPTRLTIPSDGKYLVTVYADWATNTTGKRSIQVRLDGTTVVAASQISSVGNPEYQSVAQILNLTAGQYLEVMAYQNRGGGTALTLDNCVAAIAKLADTSTVQSETLSVALSDETTDITAGTGRLTYHMPFAMSVTEVMASLTTVSSSGAVTVDINEGASSILSTKLTIDQSEETSLTAAVPAVLSDTALAKGAKLTFDVDGAGTGAKGLKVHITGIRAA